LFSLHTHTRWVYGCTHTHTHAHAFYTHTHTRYTHTRSWLRLFTARLFYTHGYHGLHTFTVGWILHTVGYTLVGWFGYVGYAHGYAHLLHTHGYGLHTHTRHIHTRGLHAFTPVGYTHAHTHTRTHLRYTPAGLGYTHTHTVTHGWLVGWLVGYLRCGSRTPAVLPQRACTRRTPCRLVRAAPRSLPCTARCRRTLRARCTPDHHARAGRRAWVAAFCCVRAATRFLWFWLPPATYRARRGLLYVDAAAVRVRDACAAALRRCTYDMPL